MRTALVAFTTLTIGMYIFLDYFFRKSEDHILLKLKAIEEEIYIFWDQIYLGSSPGIFSGNVIPRHVI